MDDEVIRANRLATNLDRVLAKSETLPDVFSLIFDQIPVCPEIFEKVDRKKILPWCEAHEAEIN